jgi:hypothetical protein
MPGIGTAQRRNNEHVNTLKSDFVSWQSQAFSWMALNQAVYFQSLRGFWPMSSRFTDAYDISGQGRTLTSNGAVGGDIVGLVAIATMNGTTQWFSRADESALQLTTMTIGGWFKFDNAAAPAAEGIIGKWNTTGSQRSFLVRRTTGEVIEFTVSTDGSSGTQVTLAGPTLIADTDWHFITGRLSPSTQMAVQVDAEVSSNTIGVPGNPFDNTSTFTIGAQDAGINPMDGSVGPCFACASYIPNRVLLTYYGLTRHAFGV